jgi:CubicO group peptidase (beta-lactamase class C family)
MRRRNFLTSLGLFSILGCAHERSGNKSTSFRNHIRSLEQLTPQLMADGKVPGASIAIVRNGGLAWTRGFGVRNSHTNAPVQDDTLFEAASVSKTAFAYVVLKQCEKGVLGLDTPLTRYTSKRFVEGDPRLDKITPRLILSHSSGLAEWRSKDAPLIRTEPGSTFEYSGEGYFYLQSALTELLGKTDPTQCATYEAGFEVCATDFDEIMKRNLLRPFGMRLSSYLAEPDWGRRIATGHDENAKPIPKDPPRRSDIARYGAVGGLRTSAQDYAKFLIEILSPKPADNFRLTQPTLKEMVRPQIKLPKDGQIDGCTAWGLGWGIQERSNGNLLVHSGGQSGFRALVIASMENKSAFAAFTNSDNGGKVIFHPDMLALADGCLSGKIARTLSNLRSNIF